MQWLDVDAMLDSMSAEQFDEWYAAYQIDRFGDKWADMRHGMLCALLANCHLPSSSPRAEMHNFMLFPDEPDGAPADGRSEEAMKLTCQMITNLISIQNDRAGG